MQPRRLALLPLVAIGLLVLSHQCLCAPAPPNKHARSREACDTNSQSGSISPDVHPHSHRRQQDQPIPSIVAPIVPLPFVEDFPSDPNGIVNFLDSRCEVCKTIVPVMKSAANILPSPDLFRLPFIGICAASLELSGYDAQPMCDGIFELYVPPIFFALKSTDLSSSDICLVLNYCINYNSTQLSRRSEASSAGDARPSPDELMALLAAATPSPASSASRGSGSPQALLGAFLHDAILAVADRPDAAAECAEPLHFDEEARLPPRAVPSVDALFEPAPPAHSTRRRQAVSNGTDPAGAGVIRILHVTDVHLDTQYFPGSSSTCGTFLCCRAIYGPGNAGSFGDYQCDLPVPTFRGMLQYIRSNFLNGSAADISYALWTGDNPAHDIWNATKESVLTANKEVGDLLKEYLGNVTVLPTFGNHDSFPHNLYYQPQDADIVNSLADQWGTWLSNETLANVREAGYYSTVLRPGLRLLSLNTNFGYRVNYYVVLNDKLPAVAKQWTFARSTLLAARNSSEKVIVIGHVPPGGVDSISSYATTYAAIVSEFADVIVLQAFGHTHLDQFVVMKTLGPPGNQTSALPEGSPVGVAFITPSVTPYININPSFRIFTLNASTFELIDYDSYYFNLTLANFLVSNSSTARVIGNNNDNATNALIASIASTQWKKLYSLRSTYNISADTPIAVAMNNVSRSMQNDTALASLYVTLQYAASAPRPCTMESGCMRAAFCFTSSPTVTRYASCLAGRFDPSQPINATNPSTLAGASPSGAVQPSTPPPAPLASGTASTGIAASKRDSSLAGGLSSGKRRDSSPSARGDGSQEGRESKKKRQFVAMDFFQSKC